MKNLKNYTIKQLHDLLYKKKVKPSDIIKNAFAVLEKNNNLNATVTVLKEEALKLARQLDDLSVPIDNYLFSIPYFAKDNFATKGILTTTSSNILSNFVPNYDASVVEILKEQKMILMGKSVLDELGMGGHGLYANTGDVLNPWDNSRITGGSSSGSAVLVASGVVPFALGSDTGDSIRKPASYNGIIGFKPTYGLISRYGLISYAPSLDTVGYFTRSVEDVAIVLDVLAKNDIRDASSILSAESNYYKNLTKNINLLKFAYIKEIQENMPSPLKDAFEKLFRKLKNMGISVNRVSFPEELLKALLPVYMIISYAEAVSTHSNLDGINFGVRCDGRTYKEIMINSRTNGFGRVVKKRYVIGSYILTNKNQKYLFLKAKKVRRLIINKLTEILNKYDILLIPSSISVAPKIKYIKEHKLEFSDIGCYVDNVLILSNFAGTPSITIPFMMIDGLPIGINLNSKIFSEQKLLNASYFLEGLIGIKNIIAGEKNNYGWCK